MKTRKKPFEIVLKNGKPFAIILGISDYKELLEKAEDAEDLAILEKMRKKALFFRNFKDFLAVEGIDV